MRPDGVGRHVPNGFAEAFAREYPELAPLAPIAEALRYVNRGPPEAVEVKGHALLGADVPFGPTPDPDAALEATSDANAAGRAEAYWTAAVTHLEEYGFLVDRWTGRVTLQNGRPGRNPSVRTIAAGLVLDGMGLKKTDPVTNEVGEQVAFRLRDALHFRRLNGRDESFKKTLRKHLLHPNRYRLAVRFSVDG